VEKFWTTAADIKGYSYTTSFSVWVKLTRRRFGVKKLRPEWGIVLCCE
jgi:hypothetical protein